MRLFRTIIVLFLLILGALSSSAQSNIKKTNRQIEVIIKLEADSAKELASDGMKPYIETENTLAAVESLRSILEIKHTDKSEKDTSKAPKNVLLVVWLSRDLEIVESLTLREYVSIGVLTQGYAIGDTIKVTLGADDEQSLVDGLPCNDLEFVGVVNYENLAILKDLFYVYGQDEKISIGPNWKNLYHCK